jgi:tripartite-type tricarboxylate transporter receptor subunit TctC
MLKAKYRDRLLAIGVALAAVMGSVLGSVFGAAADVFPSRPITIVVPYAAGGLFDSIARALAESMRVALSQSVVIENVGGAGGSIALGRVARAAADGYTISVGSGDQFVVNAAIYPLQYDVVQDFEPVSLLMNGPNLIISKNEIPAKNLKELVAWLKANHANVAQGHNGAGGSLHLCGVELQRVTGASWPFVPYRGAAPALQDVIGGRIDVMCTSPASSLEMVRNGLVRGYAITGNTRLATAPDIPTVDEAGFPGFHISVWGGLFAPKGTPKDVIAKLNAAAVHALADPAVRARLVALGQEIFPRDRNARSAGRAAKSRDREVVADHQGGEHQGGLSFTIVQIRDCRSISGPPVRRSGHRRRNRSGRSISPDCRRKCRRPSQRRSSARPPARIRAVLP